jgi:hypothetical protein
MQFFCFLTSVFNLYIHPIIQIGLG